MENKIYRVRVNLTKDGFNFKSDALHCEEKPTMYIVEGYKRIKKDKIMKPSQVIDFSFTLMHCYTYCFGADIENAYLLLRNYIVANYKKNRQDIEALGKWIED